MPRIDVAVPGIPQPLASYTPAARAGVKTARAPCESSRSRPGIAAARVVARHAARIPERSGCACMRLLISTSRDGRMLPVRTACSRISAPASCPAISGRGPSASREKPPSTSANSILVTQDGLVGAADNRSPGAVAEGW